MRLTRTPPGVGFTLLCLALAVPVPALEAQSWESRTVSGSDEKTQIVRYLSHRTAPDGDTIRFRAVFRNLAESDLSVSHLPCGARLVGEGVDLRPLVPPATCEPEIVRLVPGDSLVSDEAFEVRSSPGTSRVEVLHAVAAATPVRPGTGGFGFRVVRPEEMTHPLTPPRLPTGTLNYVLGFTRDVALDVSRGAIGDAVRHAISQRGFASTASTCVAARAMLPIPFVLVEVEDRPGSRLNEISVRLVWDDLTDRGEASLDEYAGCRTSTGGVLEPVVLGSALALAVDRLLDRLESGTCPRS